MAIPKLTKAFIREHATSQSYQRGESYYQGGAVSALIQRGNTLNAEVEGSEYQPYRISISFDQGGITAANCSCPYDWGGWCKHIVATLLACANEPKSIEERPALDEMLAPLSREQLLALLQKLIIEQPEIVDAIDSELTRLRAKSQSGRAKRSARQTSVDPRPFQRQVQHILRGVESYRDDEPALAQIRSLVEKAQGFTEQGDGNNALIILSAIIDAYVKDWMNLDGSDGGSGDFFDELDEALTEAALSAQLSAQDRKEWHKQIRSWQKEIDDYGIDDAFEMSQAAFEHHWDYAPLVKVLQGKITNKGAWQGEAPDYADELAGIRLKILERQQRFQEYLYLAEAESQMEQYFTMLVKVGRAAEAVQESLKYMRSPHEAFALAQALREQGQLAEALRVAEHGLNLKGDEGRSSGQLALWTSELAEGMGNSEKALQARVIAFKHNPTLNDYLKAQQLAGKTEWPKLKKKLLAILHRTDNFFAAEEKVEIYLHESMLDEAIATVDGLHSYSSESIQKVMAAVLEKRPDWVIKNACKRAESIMDEGQSKYYGHAIEWLKRAREAYGKRRQEKAWKAYQSQLVHKHAKKHKLREMLQKL